VWTDLSKEDTEAINRKEKPDPTVLFNAQPLFARLKKHQDIKRGHLLRFKETIIAG